MEFCFGLLQKCGTKSSASLISIIILCSMLCMWTSVEGWTYHHSTTYMNWEQARAWCREHYTDMVAIQNQEEIAYLNSHLPKQKSYYWIGIRKVDNIWTWVGTKKPLTAEATNWARGEPNNKGKRGSGLNEDCVEMYIQREMQAGKWNDERCTKNKTALCYAASCNVSSCVHGDCEETINNIKCACYEGFYGKTCENVVKCNEEEVRGLNCTNIHGKFSYGSSCQHSCEEGYRLSMSRPLTCTADGVWSEQRPTCDLVQCKELSRPANGYMNCSHRLGPFSYNSTCKFSCDEGHDLVGSPSDTLQCEATGLWNSSQPFCVAVQCPKLQELENGFINCGDDSDIKFSYGNTCSFSCAPGYRLVGPDTVTCKSSAEWSERMPVCEVATCKAPGGSDDHLITQCSQNLSELPAGSSCIFSCDAGFELQGANILHCSEKGEWSEAIPICKAKGCPAPKIPANAQISCSSSPSSPASVNHHPAGTVCTFSCDAGHELEGAPSMECAHLGQWASSPPTCTAVRCPLLETPENGGVNCSDDKRMYNSQCSFTCNQDYTLQGHELLTCNRHGNWTGDTPTCHAPAPVTAIASGATAGGALTLSGLSLATYILKKLKKKASKFELSSNSDIEVPHSAYKNSIDSLI